MSSIEKAEISVLIAERQAVRTWVQTLVRFPYHSAACSMKLTERPDLSCTHCLAVSRLAEMMEVK